MSCAATTNDGTTCSTRPRNNLFNSALVFLTSHEGCHVRGMMQGIRFELWWSVRLGTSFMLSRKFQAFKRQQTQSQRCSRVSKISRFDFNDHICHQVGSHIYSHLRSTMDDWFETDDPQSLSPDSTISDMNVLCCHDQ